MQFKFHASATANGQSAEQMTQAEKQHLISVNDLHTSFLQIPVRFMLSMESLSIWMKVRFWE